jgi:hypothetical protein
MKPKAKKDPKPRQSSRFFERIAVETFSENQLNFFGLDAAQSLFQMEKFLVDFAEKDAIFHKMFDNEKSTFSILHRRLRSFFLTYRLLSLFLMIIKFATVSTLRFFYSGIKKIKRTFIKL